MPKPGPKKLPPSSRAGGADRQRPSMRSLLRGVAILAAVGLCVGGYIALRRHVEKSIAFRPDAPRVVLKSRPAWMSDGVAKKIIAVATPDVASSAFNHELLVNTASLLKSHPDTAPWIRQVKSVRRAFDKAPGDLLEIDCDFRAPVALVRYGDFFWLIDGDGILLPEQYTAADVQKVLYDPWRKPNLRIIEGVAAAPPEAGQKWRGDDLASAIELAKLIHGRACADEVERINVANFAGRQDRREAQLVLITRYQTQVRWGRPVNAKDFFIEVSPAQKLLYMEQLVEKFGRVDARHSAVDLRFDVVTFPSAEILGAEASGQSYGAP